MTIHTLILAAGQGQRFCHGMKQLALIDEQTILERCIRTVEKVTPEHYSIVLGCQHEQLIPLVNKDKYCVNKQWQEGVGRSISFGVKQIAKTSTAVMIVLCDQVAVTCDDLLRLKNAYDLYQHQHADTTIPPIFCSTYADCIGAPAIFNKAYYSSLTSLNGDKGAQSLIMQNPHVAVEMINAKIDIDTTEQLIRFKNTASTQTNDSH